MELSELLLGSNHTLTHCVQLSKWDSCVRRCSEDPRSPDHVSIRPSEWLINNIKTLQVVVSGFWGPRNADYSHSGTDWLNDSPFLILARVYGYQWYWGSGEGKARRSVCSSWQCIRLRYYSYSIRFIYCFAICDKNLTGGVMRMGQKLIHFELLYGEMFVLNYLNIYSSWNLLAFSPIFLKLKALIE